MGVNSGTAGVGATKIEGTAGTRWTYTASGPVTNLAARLAALGEGDAVILGGETAKRLDVEFGWRTGASGGSATSRSPCACFASRCRPNR